MSQTTTSTTTTKNAGIQTTTAPDPTAPERGELFGGVVSYRTLAPASPELVTITVPAGDGTATWKRVEHCTSENCQPCRTRYVLDNDAEDDCDEDYRAVFRDCDEVCIEDGERIRRVPISVVEASIALYHRHFDDEGEPRTGAGKPTPATATTPVKVDLPAHPTVTDSDGDTWMPSTALTYTCTDASGDTFTASIDDTRESLALENESMIYDVPLEVVIALLRAKGLV